MPENTKLFSIKYFQKEKPRRILPELKILVTCVTDVTAA
jgi:hypothetical protein